MSQHTAERDPDWACWHCPHCGGQIDDFEAVKSESAKVPGIGQFRPDHPQADCTACGHQSDCATHNEPAMVAGPCNCGLMPTEDA